VVTNSNNPQDPTNTRRWPRFPAQLPVMISVETEEASKPAIPGLASEISRSGMALYGGVQVEPGDRMEVEFQTSGKPRVTGIVRNRSGFCFGLEFPSLIGASRTAQAEAAWADDLLGLPAAEVPREEPAPASLRNWLAAHRGSVTVAIGTALILLAALGFSILSAEHNLSQPRTTTQPLTLFERTLISLGMAEAPPDPVAPGGNPAAQVWVDPHTALYYCSGAELYGKTLDGRFESQRDAQFDRFEPAARKSCE
jgi:hypothetical protein